MRPAPTESSIASSSTALVSTVIDERGIGSMPHFAAKTVVPESVTDPLAWISTIL
jgi:UDP-glucose 4-epimerase